MSSIYRDTSALVPLYVPESFSARMKADILSGAEPGDWHALHQLEFENALRLKRFRKEMSRPDAAGVLARLEEDLRAGRWVRRSVDWIAAFDAARRLGEEVTPRYGCRSLDLLHVAIAVQWRCDAFYTADERQSRAARQAGLRALFIRDLPEPDSGSAPGGPPAARESRGRYRTRGRT